MSDTKQPYRMGMLESFMYRCGYVRKSKCEVIAHGPLDEIKAGHTRVRWAKAVETGRRHLPNKALRDWDEQPNSSVMLHFSDSTKAEIVGEEAKAILEAK